MPYRSAAGGGRLCSCSNPSSQHPANSITKQKKATPEWVLPAAAGGIRTPGTWRRRTQTSKPKRRPGAILGRFCTSFPLRKTPEKPFPVPVGGTARHWQSNRRQRRAKPGRRRHRTFFSHTMTPPKNFVLRMKKLCHIQQKLEMPILSIKNLRFAL